MCVSVSVSVWVCMCGRYGSVYRQAQSVGGPAVQSKLDAARDEVEDCVTKVDQMRVCFLFLSLHCCHRQ